VRNGKVVSRIEWFVVTAIGERDASGEGEVVMVERWKMDLQSLS